MACQLFSRERKPTSEIRLTRRHDSLCDSYSLNKRSSPVAHFNIRNQEIVATLGSKISCTSSKKTNPSLNRDMRIFFSNSGKMGNLQVMQSPKVLHLVAKCRIDSFQKRILLSATKTHQQFKPKLMPANLTPTLRRTRSASLYATIEFNGKP